MGRAIFHWVAAALLMVLVVMTQACSDDDATNNASSSSVSSATPQVNTGVWYVGALEDKSSSKYYPFTVQGTNFSVLTNGVRTTWGVAIVGVEYVGGSLYIGAANNGGISWKNNGSGILSFSNAQATGLAVSGNDIIMTGEASSKPAIWVNGVETALGEEYGIASAVAIDATGKPVVLGNYFSASYVYLPCWWRDGVRTDLTMPAGYSLDEMSSLVFSGTQMITTGTLRTNSVTTGCFWDVDGVHLLSKPEGHNSFAAGVVVVNSVARVVGWTEASSIAEPCVWSNGIRTTLPLPTGATSAFAQTISIDSAGGAELVAGCALVADVWIPCLWTNGTATLVNFNTNLYKFYQSSKTYAIAVR